MISVTYFALENIAMSKGNVHQDQSDQHEDGQGQVRSVMLYFNMFSHRLFKRKQLSQTVVYNFIKEVHQTLLKRRGSKTTAWGGGTLGRAGGQRKWLQVALSPGGHHQKSTTP